MKLRYRFIISIEISYSHSLRGLLYVLQLPECEGELAAEFVSEQDVGADGALAVEVRLITSRLHVTGLGQVGFGWHALGEQEGSAGAVWGGGGLDSWV